ncbi:MAG: hypothetical protein LKE30_03660 [Bacteroidales bacterium]|nr:hypothetical protein [Bacteroidales bacterium]
MFMIEWHYVATKWHYVTHIMPFYHLSMAKLIYYLFITNNSLATMFLSIKFRP